MTCYRNHQSLLGFCLLFFVSTNSVIATETQAKQECFESRDGMSQVRVQEIGPELMNVKCSSTTGGVLWWGDPFEGTIPMGDMEVEGDYTHEEAVVKPREPQLDRNKMLTICSMACHDGSYVPIPHTKTPRPLKMHLDTVPDAMNLKHGKGGIWCLDCHHLVERTKLIDNFGYAISFNQPQKLCGKCHGQVYRAWRDGIHGKRIGMWDKGGKKRWWVCTECHNPHDVEHDNRNSGFAQLRPEPAPNLPKGMTNADHERMHHGPKQAEVDHE
ncbi:MAG: hypothetical protein B6D78_17745 [gamma proteobacterium symbiont of Ctena orbiculata]|nr:MAG: hypothetical protein B6D78_17745 [gamma proteobacterium symbiont of Ctena orbiculata]PVV24540.1 MAG: hypothetical protein B6D79_10795 [gamma proteobacterium symbiont of Ctena orbiculata]